MSSTNAAQPQEGQIVQLTWKEVKSMQEDLKAYRGLVRMLSRELSAAKKALESEQEHSKFLSMMAKDILETARTAVKRVEELRSELATTIRERNELRQKLEEQQQ